MSRLILLFLAMSGFFANSQEYQEVHITELDMDLIKESVMQFSILGEPLDGNFKVNNYEAGDYTIATFREGKVHGVSKNYRQNQLTGLNEYAYGLENGQSLAYDVDGNVIIRVHWKDGKIHGIVWHKDVGETYYLMDKEVTKKEYESYIMDQQKN